MTVKGMVKGEKELLRVLRFRVSESTRKGGKGGELQNSLEC